MRAPPVFRHSVPRVTTLAVAAFTVACAERPNLEAGTSEWQRPAAGAGEAAATNPRVESADAPTVIFIGTSLTAGYGLSADQAYPARVAALAARDGVPINAVNAGVSGETSAGALRRVEWVLRTPAEVVVVETGANDGLRGLSVEAARENITRIVREIQRVRPQAMVVLVQMEAPPNLGADYTARFSAMYPAIAAETGATLIPFLLEGVAAVREFNLPDGIHPNAAGTERVAANVWQHLRPLIARLHDKRAAAVVPAGAAN
jgi:acyl-CoA thioesterase I